MKYGDWQLRDDSAYWKSQNIILYPSTNSVDEGMVHSEKNVRNIVRRITTQSYTLDANSFVMKLSADRKTVTVSAGRGNIQGYDLTTNAPIDIAVPNTVTAQQWTLGISLSYDANNHVVGDAVVHDKPLEDNEYFGGVYLYWFDKCQLEANYNRILVLGRVWAKDGAVLQPGDVINTGDVYDDDNNRVIDNPVESDPHNNLGIDGAKVRIFTSGLDSMSEMGKGVFRTPYDTLPENITTVFQYDSMKYPVEQDRSQYTKPPVMGTSLQDYINYMPDWYTSKYGDYMTGALRMDHLSIDRKMELDPDHAKEYIKDSASPQRTVKFTGTEGIFISPRTLGKLTTDKIEADASNTSAIDKAYKSGGTIMSIVPRTYLNGIDATPNIEPGTVDTAAYAALISQTPISSESTDTGLIIHTTAGGKSRLSMYDDTDKLRLENISKNLGKSSIEFNDGRIFIDSYNDGGIIIHSAKSTSDGRNLDFAFTQDQFLISKHSLPTSYASYTHDIYKKNIEGKNTDTDYIKLGVHSTYDSPSGTNYTRSAVNDSSSPSTGPFDPYLQIGNMRARSNSSSSQFGASYRVNTLEIVNPGGTWSSNISGLPDIHGIDGTTTLPYLRIMPGIFSRSELLEDFIQIGTSKVDDIKGLEATKNTANKVLISRKGVTDTSGAYTIIEQDYYKAKQLVMNKLMPPIAPASTDANRKSTARDYQEIAGIYSHGNIGCSSYEITPHKTSTTDDEPYKPTSEWVRLTQFRYDNDNDVEHSGSFNPGSSLRPRKKGSTYNIEFNTTVKNARANQIIWNYHSADGTEAHQPLTLSYIHDELNASLNGKTGGGTKYPADTYQDFNNYIHKDPTYGTRDFLRIDGGGLSVHGDINNPALAGDNNSDSTAQGTRAPLGVTILHGRVYGSIYNDYAETYKKANPDEKVVEGMIVSLDPETQEYKICDTPEDTLVVGVISDNYGMLLGGKRIDGALDELDMVNQTEYFAVGVSGKVLVNVDSDVELGDLLVSSDKRGLATPVDRLEAVPGTIIGKVVSEAHEVEGQDYKQCLMQIMLA